MQSCPAVRQSMRHMTVGRWADALTRGLSQHTCLLKQGRPPGDCPKLWGQPGAACASKGLRLVPLPATSSHCWSFLILPTASHELFPANTHKQKKCLNRSVVIGSRPPVSRQSPPTVLTTSSNIYALVPLRPDFLGYHGHVTTNIP